MLAFERLKAQDRSQAALGFQHFQKPPQIIVLLFFSSGVVACGWFATGQREASKVVATPATVTGQSGNPDKLWQPPASHVDATQLWVAGGHVISLQPNLLPEVTRPQARSLVTTRLRDLVVTRSIVRGRATSLRPDLCRRRSRDLCEELLEVA